MRWEYYKHISTGSKVSSTMRQRTVLELVTEVVVVPVALIVAAPEEPAPLNHLCANVRRRQWSQFHEKRV